ncbi:MAG: ATP-binding protein [Actinomycetota bacterium]|nr:ATP-binding protein [Actinomycetota bacterium]
MKEKGGEAATRLFDLNIEEVLDNWEVSHAIREIISNALDEQVLSDSEDISIERTSTGEWVVRDFGRGLRIEHFTLNENKEKLGRESGVIGKFGVGLKDALATFHRRGIGVTIRSSHGTFSPKETSKHNFSDISTLHVAYDETPVDMRGTQFLLTGVTDEQMAEAKSLFLRFNDDRILESTRYGEVLEARGDGGRVYISGVFASEEPNFLFSYNVTSLTDAMKKRLNRERLNVGRTTYADRVKSILKTVESDEVLDGLARAIMTRATTQPPDEIAWIEVTVRALTELHLRQRIVFVTEKELHAHPDVIDHARSDGLQIVIVTAQEKQKLLEQAKAGGVEVRTIETYVVEFNSSFEYRFVDPEDLSAREAEVFGLTDDLLSLIGVSDRRRPDVRISETLRLTRDDTNGVWDPHLPAIVIKREMLRSPLDYGGTLLHEAAHALTGALDATREFEWVLTTYLGKTSSAALK